MNDLSECIESPSAPPLASEAKTTESKPHPPTIERHSRKCQVCRHPDREDIEQEYLDWFRPSQIARDYNINDQALYRHFHAMGMVSARRENLSIILDHILERGAELPISGDTIIRAIRAQCCLNESLRWVEPPKTVIYIREDPNPNR